MICSCRVDIPLFGILEEGVGAKGEKDENKSEEDGAQTTNRNIQSRPGKRGFPLSISARTQPTLHMSIARVYSLKVSITSGARYHLFGGN